MKRSLSIVLLLSLLLSMLPMTYAEGTTELLYWVESSYRNVFQDAVPGNEQTVQLVMAKNEYESSQIVLKANKNFTINSVNFSQLTGQNNAVITADNFFYNYIGYEALPKGSSGISTSMKGSGNYPEWLLNNRDIAVTANTAQPIWITFYIPPNTTPSTYTGRVNIDTSLGSIAVDITLEVCDVTIPEANVAECNFYFWQANVGWYNKPRNEDSIERFYGYSRYSEEWWSLMEKFAESNRRNRNNFLMVPTVTLLFDGGTTLDADGQYTFVWDKFDQFVQFMLDSGCVKHLVGNQLAYRNNGWGSNYESYIIDRDLTGASTLSNVTIACEKTENWFSQFLPALRDHLKTKIISGTQKTWLDIWQQSIVDEPYTEENSNNWVTLYSYVNQYSPEFFVQEAIQSRSYNEKYVGKLDAWIIQLDVLESNYAFYNTQKSNGNQVWMYTCLSPKGNYLNRFVDQPVWMGRSLMWLLFQKDLDGYLHWGWNAWHYAKPRDPYGDCYSVWPDVENGTITETIRLTALRDGAEEYEMLRILERTQPAIATLLCEQVVKSGTQYTSDPKVLQEKRNTLIRAAAGETPDIPIITELPFVENFENGSSPCTVINGAWNIETLDNNHVYVQEGTDSEAIVLFGASDADYAVQVNLAVKGWANGKAAGVLGRYNDQNNYYLWRIGNVAGENRLQLLRKVNGQFTTLFEQAVPYDAFEMNNLKLVLSGSVLKGYFNGELKTELEDLSLSSGCAGVRGYATDFYIDDICVTDIEMDSLEYLPQTAMFDDTEGWQRLDGIWSVEQTDGAASFVQSSPTGTALAIWGHPLWKNYTASTNIHVDQFNGDSSVGLIFGVVDDMNYYLWRVAQDNSGNQLLQMFKCDNGSFTRLYTEPISDTLHGSDIFLEAAVNENVVIVKYNGQEKFRYIGDAEIQGEVGFRSLNSTFKVISLTVAEESSVSTVSDISVAPIIESKKIELPDSANLVIEESANSMPTAD